MAIYEELTIDQGSTFDYEFNLKDTATGEAYNLSSFTVNAYMKKSYKSVNATAVFTAEVDINTAGRIKISLTDEQTAAIKAGRYVYDVIIESPLGKVYRIVEGMVDVTPAVTIITP